MKLWFVLVVRREHLRAPARRPARGRAATGRSRVTPRTIATSTAAAA